MPKGPLHGVTVLHVGHFDPTYSRNRIMAKALLRAGAQVLPLSDPRPFARRAPHLTREVVRAPGDVVLVGFPGHADVALGRLAGLAARRPVLFDAFVSLLETAQDRQGPTLGFATALRYAAEDRIACRLADTVILDTDTHCRYFGVRFGVSPAKLRKVWVGADDDVVRPSPLPTSGFRVFIYSNFIPLHGLEHVVRAAYLLEQRGAPVVIDLIGDGATAPAIRNLAEVLGVRSLTFHGRKPFDQIVASMAASHVCLGIFGTSEKASRVVPNKVFDGLAAARPVITAGTPAAREALTHGVHAWFCRPGDATALADALEELRDRPDLRSRLAADGYERFKSMFSIDAISRDLAPIVLEALG
jgi:glycosyltransferase involved in cell wall biosynthesis